jgi:hypothetical protein
MVSIRDARGESSSAKNVGGPSGGSTISIYIDSVLRKPVTVAALELELDRILMDRE